MIVKTFGSQMGSPALVEEGGEAMEGGRGEGGERSEVQARSLLMSTAQKARSRSREVATLKQTRALCHYPCTSSDRPLSLPMNTLCMTCLLCLVLVSSSSTIPRLTRLTHEERGTPLHACHVYPRAWHVCVCVRACLRAGVHVCLRVRVCVCMCACACACACVNAICLCACLYACVCLRACVRVSVCVFSSFLQRVPRNPRTVTVSLLHIEGSLMIVWLKHFGYIP